MDLGRLLNTSPATYHEVASILAKQLGTARQDAPESYPMDVDTTAGRMKIDFLLNGGNEKDTEPPQQFKPAVASEQPEEFMQHRAWPATFPQTTTTTYHDSVFIQTMAPGVPYSTAVFTLSSSSSSSSSCFLPGIPVADEEAGLGEALLQLSAAHHPQVSVAETAAGYPDTGVVKRKDIPVVLKKKNNNKKTRGRRRKQGGILPKERATCHDEEAEAEAEAKSQQDGNAAEEQLQDDAAISQQKQKKTRRRLKSEELFLLESVFACNATPDSFTKIKLAQVLRMTPQQVSNWFQNKRSRVRRELKESQQADNHNDD